MPKISMLDQNGNKVKSITLSDDVFGIEPNKSVLFDAITMQRASLRQGTHKVKNRSAVRGGGRKPWRQKGTGNARQGTIRAVQWVGGGVAFGPTPRSYAYSLNRKVRKLALKSALSLKFENNSINVIENLNFEIPKTKQGIELMSNLKLDGKVLIVTKEIDENIALSVRNLKNVVYLDAAGVNVLDLVNSKHLVITHDAAQVLEEVLS